MSRFVRIASGDQQAGASFLETVDVCRGARGDHDPPRYQRFGREAVAIVVGICRIEPDRHGRHLFRCWHLAEKTPLDVVSRTCDARASSLDHRRDGRAEEHSHRLRLLQISADVEVRFLDGLGQFGVLALDDSRRAKPRKPRHSAVDVDDVDAANVAYIREAFGRNRSGVDARELPLVFGRIFEEELADAHGRDRHCKINGLAQLTIGVYSDRKELSDVLRERCPSVSFADESGARDACRVAIVDDDWRDRIDDSPRKSVVRILLGAPHERRQGELNVARDVFLAAPDDFIAFASDLAETAIHASQLEIEITYLTQIAELMSMTEANAVSERITRTVLNILGLSRGTLFIHDPRLERYVVSFTNDPDMHETGEFLPGIPPDLLQRALSSGESYAYDRAAGMIVMTLQVEHDLIGVIKVPLRDEPVDAEAIASVSRYIRAVASVLGNIYQLTRSRDLAMRDDLTKAYNRRFFESYLDEEIERARRYGSLFSIIFLDLDDLKMVNNFYGHLTGSRTLQEVAKRILNAVRGIDKVVRFGGDEFCIILPQTDQEQAVLVANRVRKALTANAYHLEPNIDISITASFGIATYPTHAITKDDLIRQADAAMYRVKSGTKNAVGVANVEDATRPLDVRH